MRVGSARASRAVSSAPLETSDVGEVFDEASNTTAGAAVLPNCGSEARAGAFKPGRAEGATISAMAGEPENSGLRATIFSA